MDKTNDVFQKAFEVHAQVYKAMAHPKRLEVINLLRESELTVGDISRMLAIPQANLSQHLARLRQAGIVKARREKRKIFYRLTSANIVRAQDLVREVLLKNLHLQDDGEVFTLDLSGAVELEIDPVCRMKLTPISASDTLDYQGERYYFCGRGCKVSFLQHPKKYLSMMDYRK
jgi:ArsR family transcriptional regulator